MRQVTQGSTDISVDVYIVDATDGTPELGVLFNTAGIDLEYRREGEAVVSITEATLALLTTAHADGGFLEIGHGYYRLDVPDAAFAAGASSVSIQGTVTGMVVLPQTIQLVAFDTQDSTRLGLTALPNANADAAGGLPISGLGGLDLDASLSGNIPQTADHTAGIADIPTVAEFNARTLLAADYFDPAVDTVTLDAAQPSITWQPMTFTAVDTNANITFSGAGTGDVFAYTRVGTGGLYDTAYEADLSAVITNNASIVDILLDTGTTIPADLAALPTAAEVNAEVVDVLEVDTHAEPTAAVAATTTIKDALMWLKTLGRNKMTQTSTTTTLRNDGDTLNISTSTVSDDATTFTRGKHL